ncbi:anti-sigma regulatory factor [Vibrio sp. VPAP30]|uniref:anti-sigma regulatory factor n=1 Tax=Vibrio sp. VPAP30 TaxID=1647102 RepID=UPI000659DBC2|nr:anti-sigma regulatory factor [Vibrio sp. VPAP30]KLN66592.1 anti-sigma B factor [Vibrio sp. VPAP30]
MLASSVAEKILESHHIYSEADVMSAVMATYTIAQKLGFSAPLVSEIATSVSELATNIVKYAGEGEVSLLQLEVNDSIGIKVVAADSGGGIADVSRALTDNYSTGKSLGLGLPGVVRMMDDFDIQSSPELGTTVSITKWKD